MAQSNEHYLIGEYSSRIGNAMKRNGDKFQNHIKHFIDKNTDILFDTGLTKRLVFADNIDKIAIEKYSEITANEMKATLRKYGLIKPQWKKWNNQIWVFNLALIIRHYAMTKETQKMNMVLTFLACGLYSSLHAKYFRYFLPNPNIMDYTINNLSNKFLIKKYGSLIKTIMMTAKTSHDTYESSLIGGSDEDIVYYLSQLNSRLNAFVKAIMKEYEENRIEKRFLNKEKEGRDEENYREVDNSSFQIANIAQSATLNLLSNKVRLKEANIAAKSAGVSNKVLLSSLETLLKKKDKEVEEFVTLILQIFIIDGKREANQIGSNLFLKETIAIYSKSNISNPRILRIKEILDDWLNETSPNYVRTERIATKSAFRKAMFQYFVFSIQSIYMKR